MKKYLHLFLAAISPAVATAQVVNIDNGLHLVAQGAIALVIDNGGMKNNGIFVPDSSTVYFDGSAGVSTSGTQPINFFNATFRGTGTKRNESDDTVAIYNVLAAEGSTIIDADGSSNNRVFVLRSVAASTASVAVLPSTADIAGKVIVERYIPARRSWRLLTAPIHSASNLTISQAWQEGVSNINRLSPVNPNPGYGTNITKSTSYAADGYDQGSTNNPSIRYYNGSSWGGVPVATNGTTVGANNGLINDQQGYMLFIRGDRSIQVAGTNVVPVNATLRPAGQLKTGTQPAVACTGWTVIGNPYASAVNFHKLVTANPGLPDEFYLWEPGLTGSNDVGGWISYGAYNAATQTYTVTPLLPGSSSATNTGDIPSGSAFMVNYNGNIVFAESCKSNGKNDALHRPVSPLELHINLLAVNPNTAVSLNDGVAILFSARRDNETIAIPKNKNFAENIAIKTNATLAIEKRMPVQVNDTIFLTLSQMKQKTYKLQVIQGAKCIPPNIDAFLEDTCLQRFTALLKNDTTLYPFSVTADSGTYAPGRFRIVYRQSKLFFSINTVLQPQNQVAVLWEMPDGSGFVGYQVEKSMDGKNFTTASPTQTIVNSTKQSKWLDEVPYPNENYYRVKCFGEDGAVTYSNAAKAVIESKAGLFVYPNPIAGNVIMLQLNDQPADDYIAALINNNGQVIFTEKWNHSGKPTKKFFRIAAAMPKGLYRLEITGLSGMKTTGINVMVQ